MAKDETMMHTTAKERNLQIHPKNFGSETKRTFSFDFLWFPLSCIKWRKSVPFDGRFGTQASKEHQLWLFCVKQCPFTCQGTQFFDSYMYFFEDKNTSERQMETYFLKGVPSSKSIFFLNILFFFSFLLWSHLNLSCLALQPVTLAEDQITPPWGKNMRIKWLFLCLRCQLRSNPGEGASI